MASEETISECCVILRLMKGEPWEPMHDRLYARIIAPWEDEFARKVIQAADDTLTWRPSRAELRLLAAKIACPIPDDDECYAEIVHKLETVGPYGQPHPERPTVMLEGAPAMSHPIVSQIVAYCGGWLSLCTGEANYSEGLKKQVRSAHESVSARWLQGAAENLTLPPGKREAVYFQPYRRYELPAGYVPGVDIGSPGRIEAARPNREPIPEEVKKLIAGMDRSIPPPRAAAPEIERKIGGLTREERKIAERDAEIVRKRMAGFAE